MTGSQSLMMIFAKFCEEHYPEANCHFGMTSSLPLNCDLRSFIKSVKGQYFYGLLREYDIDDIESLLALTTEEIEELHLTTFYSCAIINIQGWITFLDSDGGISDWKKLTKLDYANFLKKFDT